MSSPILNESLRKGNISVYRHVVPDLYLAMTLNQSIEPSEQSSTDYETRYKIYKKLYPQLISLLRQC